MAKNVNSNGLLILSDLTMDEKVEVILEAWGFLEKVNTAFYEEFGQDSESFNADDAEEFQEELEGLGENFAWTSMRGNSDVIKVAGLEIGVYGTAYLQGFTPPDWDPDGEIWGYFLSKTSREGATGLYRSVYAENDPSNLDLPLSDSEKESGSWSDAPYAWILAHITCPFCDPIQWEGEVECPFEDSRLDRIAWRHRDGEEVWTDGEGF